MAELIFEIAVIGGALALLALGAIGLFVLWFMALRMKP